MIFRQLFESDSSTYSYLLGCERTGEALIIDPVIDTAERDLAAVKSLGLTLRWTLDTHIHADHLTGARKLRALCGSKIAAPAMDGLSCADAGVREGEAFRLGDITLNPLFTPGHTSTHHAYVLNGDIHTLLFSGDALLIEACGRTDFQSGDAKTLYRTITEKFFTLPDDTLIYPAHDYEQRHITTILQEKQRNPRLADTSEAEFVELMEGLDLPYPRKIDFAVPGNEQCGQCPDDMLDEYRGPCNIREVQSEARVIRSGDQG